MTELKKDELETQKEMQALVSAVHKERYEIIYHDKRIFAKLKSSAYYNKAEENIPTTGDFVKIIYNPFGDSLIVETLPRKTLFLRSNPTRGKGGQVIAANFDYVFIMSSLNNNLNLNRIQRYLILTYKSKAIPVIILTKADLIENINTKIDEVKKSIHNVDVVAISILNGYGLESLNPYLRPGKTIVFLGSSGVGKSSLVNALYDHQIMDVKTIRQSDDKGRHTTTHRQLITLPDGVNIIDTPGMRELGLFDINDEVDNTFEDVEKYFGRCRFNDCRHDREPGCAIRKAIEENELSEKRWMNYLSLKLEIHHADRRARALINRQERIQVKIKKEKSQNNSI